MSIKINNWRTDIPGELDEWNDIVVWAFPTINGSNSYGKPTFWRIFVYMECRVDNKWCAVDFDDSALDNGKLPNDIRAAIMVESGLVGGKTRDTVPTIVAEGKNIGKRNETNVVCQALRDALSMYNTQKKKTKTAIATSSASSDTMYAPMLAKTFKDENVVAKMFAPPANSSRTSLNSSSRTSSSAKIDAISVPKRSDEKRSFSSEAPQRIALQRKYNGTRCLAFRNGAGDIIMYSRRKLEIFNAAKRGFIYIAAEVARLLEHAPPGTYFDGELYKHGLSLQRINGIVAREDKTDCPELQYYIYDMFIPAQPALSFTERSAIIARAFDGADAMTLPHLVQVETYEVKTIDEAHAKSAEFVAEGYEGAMLRAGAAPYLHAENDRRSDGLVKIKPHYDEEFEVVNITAATNGKAAGALMIVLRTETGKEFSVTPAMELEARVDLYKRLAANNFKAFKAEYLGRMVRVYFDEKSDDGTPLRGRTKLERMGVEIL